MAIRADLGVLLSAAETYRGEGCQDGMKRDSRRSVDKSKLTPLTRSIATLQMLRWVYAQETSPS